MKSRLCFFLCAMALAFLSLPTFAQMPTVSLGPVNKSFSQIHSEDALVICEDPSSLILVTRRASLLGHTAKDLIVRKVDKVLNTEMEVKVENTTDVELIAANANDSVVVLLYCDHDRTSTRVLRSVYDRATLNHLRTTSPYEANFSRRSDSYLWHRRSPDGRFTGLVSVVVTKGVEVLSDVVLFDPMMNVVWAKKDPIGACSDLFVTNDGRMILVGYYHRAFESTIAFYRYDAQRMDEMKTEVAEGILSAAIVNVVGNRVLVGGTLLSIDTKRGENNVGGVFAMAYDVEERMQVNFSVSMLNKDDIAVLTDVKQKARIRATKVDKLQIEQTVPTQFGGAVSFSRPYVLEKTSSNGDVTAFHHRLGLLVLAMDDQGKVVYKAPFRHNLVQNNGNDLLTMPLISDGSNVSIFNVESTKEPLDYNIAKRTKEVGINRKSANTVIYSISPRGDVVHKEIVAAKVKGKPAGASIRWFGDSYYMFVTSGKGSRLVQVSRTR